MKAVEADDVEIVDDRNLVESWTKPKSGWKDNNIALLRSVGWHLNPPYALDLRAGYCSELSSRTPRSISKIVRVAFSTRIISARSTVISTDLTVVLTSWYCSTRAPVLESAPDISPSSDCINRKAQLIAERTRIRLVVFVEFF